MVMVVVVRVPTYVPITMVGVYLFTYAPIVFTIYLQLRRLNGIYGYDDYVSTYNYNYGIYLSIYLSKFRYGVYYVSTL